MAEQFFALLPSAGFSAFVEGCKRAALAKVGPQKYLEDAPHLTLAVGDYPWSDALGSAVAGVATSAPRGLRLGGWHTFSRDPVTGGETLVIKVLPEDLAALRAFQVRFLEAVAPLRATPVPGRYAGKAFPPAMAGCLERYGYPFAGDVWEPHFSIASFRPEDYGAAWAELSGSRPPADTGSLALAYCEIGEGGFAVRRSWPAPA